MSFALQQTSQTISSLSFAFPDVPIGPGKKDDAESSAPPRDALSEAAKVAEKAAVVIEALRSVAEDLKQNDRDRLRGVTDYQRLGRALEVRSERAERPERDDDRPENTPAFEAIRHRISETTIQGEGFSASLYRTQSVSIGPEGRAAQSTTFGDISLEVDGFEVEISFNQVVQFDEKTGLASAERFGEVSISGEGFEATLGFQQLLELGPDGPSASSGRFAEFSIESDGIEAQFAYGQVAGFDPAGIFVASQEKSSAVAKTEGGTVAVEIFRQLEAYLHRDDEKPEQSLLSVG